MEKALSTTTAILFLLLFSAVAADSFVNQRMHRRSQVKDFTANGLCLDTAIRLAENSTFRKAWRRAVNRTAGCVLPEEAAERTPGGCFALRLRRRGQIVLALRCERAFGLHARSSLRGSFRSCTQLKPWRNLKPNPGLCIKRGRPSDATVSPKHKTFPPQSVGMATSMKQHRGTMLSATRSKAIQATLSPVSRTQGASSIQETTTANTTRGIDCHCQQDMDRLNVQLCTRFCVVGTQFCRRSRYDPIKPVCLCCKNSYDVVGFFECRDNGILRQREDFPVLRTCPKSITSRKVDS